MNLYELTSEAAHLADLIEASDGEVDARIEAALARLDEISTTLPMKVDNYGKLIALIEGRAQAKDDFAAKLKNAAEMEWDMVDRLKRRLKEAMELAGERKIVTDLFPCRIQKNGQPSIEWKGTMAELPAEFKRVTESVDRAAALAALNEGRELPSGFEVKHGTHLRFG